MPTYVYRCQSCSTLQEAVQRITDDPLTTCEDCGGSLRRVLQPVGIVFKGSGFYVTDYKRSDSGNGKNLPAANVKSEGGESKPAADTPAKPAADTSAKKDSAPAAAAAS
jgi:putative FmdB family regulatory protein